MTSYLIDTNIISEFHSRKKDNRWLAETPQPVMYISALTLAEIHKGIHNPRISSAKKRELHHWFEKSLLPSFTGRILVFDEICAAKWGEITAMTDRTMPVIDSLIAATALAHDLTVVTRNERDFYAIPGLKVINP